MTEHKRRPYVARMAPEARREQLMDVALELIAEGGIGRVTVEAVAKQADVSRTVVYGVFEDSDHILRSVLSREEDYALGVLTRLVPESDAGIDLVQTLTHMLRGFLVAVSGEPLRWRAILLPVDGQPGPAQRRIERGYRTLLDLTQSFVEDGASRTGVALADPELTSRLILNVTMDAARLHTQDPEAYPVERLVDFAQGVLAGMLGSSTRSRG